MITQYNIEKLFNENINSKFILDISKKLRGSYKHICIFGASNMGKYFYYEVLKHFNVKADFFCDNNKKIINKTICDDVKCISFEELINIKRDTLVIITSKHYKEIYTQLTEYGFNNILELCSMKYLEFNFNYSKNRLVYLENIIKLYNILDDDDSRNILYKILKNYLKESPVKMDFKKIKDSKKGYSSIIKIGLKDSFIDCGAFNGDTVIEFIEKSKGEFAEIHAFEIDENNYEKMQESLLRYNDKYDNINLYKIGLWDKREILKVDIEGNELSKITNDGKSESIVDSLDNILKGNKVTLIKMDIEGAEYNALKGATNIIKEQKPSLAISIYHLLDDLWTIPILIKKIEPQYKIYIRHHEDDDTETMCYAVI